MVEVGSRFVIDRLFVRGGRRDSAGMFDSGWEAADAAAGLGCGRCCGGC
jgi:hypothetical protein